MPGGLKSVGQSRRRREATEKLEGIIDAQNAKRGGSKLTDTAAAAATRLRAERAAGKALSEKRAADARRRGKLGAGERRAGSLLAKRRRKVRKATRSAKKALNAF